MQPVHVQQCLPSGTPTGFDDRTQGKRSATLISPSALVAGPPSPLTEPILDELLSIAHSGYRTASSEARRRGRIPRRPLNLRVCRIVWQGAGLTSPAWRTARLNAFRRTLGPDRCSGRPPPRPVTVPVLADADDEPDEVFLVELSPPLSAGEHPPSGWQGQGLEGAHQESNRQAKPALQVLGNPAL